MSAKVIPLSNKNENTYDSDQDDSDQDDSFLMNEYVEDEDGNPITDSSTLGENFDVDKLLLEDRKNAPLLDQLLWLGFSKDCKEFGQQFEYENLKSIMRWFIDSAKINISITFDDLTMAMTLFVLFADNIKQLVGDKSMDVTFIDITTVSFFCFIFELVGSTWSKTNFKSFYPLRWDGYFLSFFWCLDVVAILSMFPDIPFISEEFGITKLMDGGNANYAKAGRVVRLVRLVRLVKLYKIASERRRRQREEEELLELVRIGAADYEEEKKKMALYDQRGSKLGAQLSDAITRKVIVIVLVMLCILPLVTYDTPDQTTQFSTQFLHEFYINSGNSADAKTSILASYINTLESNDFLNDTATNPFLIYLDISPFYPNPVIYRESFLSELRASEMTTIEHITYVNNSEHVTKAIFNNQNAMEDAAFYSILLTLFVGGLIVTGSVVFTNDAQNLVLDPIERMMNMVDAVANDPLAKLQFKEPTPGTVSAGEYETRLLETTVEKITGLLRVGFGEAGAGIISANLKSGSHSINPLLPGIRIYAIVGFCDIHHFEECNLLLKSDIMTFCNSIAEIVHSSVHYWGGQCNKNLGNAFVIIWRIGDEATLNAITNMGIQKRVSQPLESEIKKRAHAIDLRRVPGVDVLADKALIGYLKIISEINRDKAILSYRKEPRLTHNGANEFKVRMGFGLHAGWAIEGAVGSLQKVDATYLSPHVNMAARLETSSRQYGVPLLASHFFHELMSPEAQSFCRKVDVVTVKGSEVPVGVYTYDALQDQTFSTKKIRVEKSRKTDKTKTSNSVEKTNENAQMNSTHTSSTTNLNASNSTDKISTDSSLKDLQKKFSFLTNRHDTTDIYEKDIDMVMLRMHITDEFLLIFKSGLDTYLEGEWPAARLKLQEANEMMKRNSTLPCDGPCVTLLNYMEEYNWTAPSTWAGFRPLTNK
jgi:class 3 adenylate cyclase